MARSALTSQLPSPNDFRQSIRHLKLRDALIWRMARLAPESDRFPSSPAAARSAPSPPAWPRLASPLAWRVPRSSVRRRPSPGRVHKDRGPPRPSPLLSLSFISNALPKPSIPHHTTTASVNTPMSFFVRAVARQAAPTLFRRGVATLPGSGPASQLPHGVLGQVSHNVTHHIQQLAAVLTIMFVVSSAALRRRTRPLRRQPRWRRRTSLAPQRPPRPSDHSREGQFPY